MAATLTIKKVHTRRLTGQRLVTGLIDFGDSYPTGGEAISLPLSEVEGMTVETKYGYIFSYNRDTAKVLAYHPRASRVAHTHAVALDGGVSGAEAAHTHAVALDTGASAAGSSHNHAFTGTDAGLELITAEALTVAADAGTLANLPAAILAIHGTVSAASTNFRVVAAARTLATGEVHVNYATGGITFYAADDPTAVTVDYLKKAAVPTGSNAAEATHTHGPGSLADAASAAGSSHTHGPGTLADAASSSDGELTAAAADEVGNGEDLSGVTEVAFVAWGW